MLYVKTITAPTSTPKDSPVTESIEIQEDAVLYIAVRLPPGPQALAGVAIFYGDEQIFPSTEGEWCIGDNEIIWDFILWKCPEKPCPLTIKMYNLDDTYSHSAIIRIVSCDKWVLYGIKFLGKFVYLAEKFFGRIIRE